MKRNRGPAGPAHPDCKVVSEREVCDHNMRRLFIKERGARRTYGTEQRAMQAKAQPVALCGTEQKPMQAKAQPVALCGTEQKPMQAKAQPVACTAQSREQCRQKRSRSPCAAEADAEVREHTDQSRLFRCGQTATKEPFNITDRSWQKSLFILQADRSEITFSFCRPVAANDFFICGPTRTASEITDVGCHLHLNEMKAADYM